MEIINLITLVGTIACNTSPDIKKCLDSYYGCVTIQMRKINMIPISKASKLTVLKSEIKNCHIKTLGNNGRSV